MKKKTHTKPPFSPGDIVVPRDDLKNVKLWGYEGKKLTVESCVECHTASTGWVVSTRPEKCPHCGHVLAGLVGYASDWFMLVERADQ